METTTSIKLKSEREPNFIVYLYLTLVLNQVSGILLHPEQFAISVLCIVGIPGAIWTIVYILRFMRSFSRINRNTDYMIFFDALAIIYNIFIYGIITELISEFNQSFYPQIFPVINIVLLTCNIFAQFHYKVKNQI